MGKTKTRIYLWDNVKALLIVSVVMGHFVTQYTGSSEVMRSMFVIIYTFHMPLFVFVSGLFAKSSIKNDKLRIDRVISYLLLYVLLKFVIFIVRISFGHNSAFRLFYEQGIPWYMLAMAVFLCLTYALRGIKPQILILITTIISLLAGFESGIGDVFSLSRIIVFFPIFLLGFYLDSNKIAEVSRKPAFRIISLIIIIAFVALSFIFTNQFYSLRPALVARLPYEKMGSDLVGLLSRIIQYILGAVISFAIICVLPNKENKLSYIGAATLPIYFIHRPILYILMDLGFGDFVMSKGGAWAFLACAVVLTFLLSWPPLKIPFDKIMKFKYTKILEDIRAIK